MRKSFDDILNECIRRIERGEDVESVLQSYAEQADELRPHLQILTSLSAVDKREVTPQGALRGHQQLLSAIVGGGRKREETGVINSLATKGGLSMKFVGMFVVGAVMALGITFLSGNLDFGGGSSSGSAQAIPIPDCVLNLDFDGDGQLGVGDVEVFRAAFGSSTGDDNYDPDLDRNNDGTIDIGDVITAVNELVACFPQGQP